MKAIYHAKTDNEVCEMKVFDCSLPSSMLSEINMIENSKLSLGFSEMGKCVLMPNLRDL